VLGKAKIDTFNKSKEKNVACREFNPKKGSKKLAKEKRRKASMGEKWRVEKPTHFREDESQVTAGG